MAVKTPEKGSAHAITKKIQHAKSVRTACETHLIDPKCGFTSHLAAVALQRHDQVTVPLITKIILLGSVLRLRSFPSIVLKEKKEGC